MKKFLVGFLMFFVFAVTVPIAVEAHNGCRRHVRKSSYNRNYGQTNRRYVNRNYARTNNRYASGRYARNTRYVNERYASRGYRYERRPSLYRRHRNLINIGVGTGAGALIGAIAGGKRGALIGAAVGAGGAAVYSYGIRPKQRRYYRRY